MLIPQIMSGFLKNRLYVDGDAVFSSKGDNYVLTTECGDFIVNPSDKGPAQGPHSKTIGKPDKASNKSDPVPDKVLAQKP